MDIQELPRCWLPGRRSQYLGHSRAKNSIKNPRKKIRECDERGMWENTNIMSNRWHTSPSTRREEQWRARPFLRKQFKQRLGNRAVIPQFPHPWTLQFLSIFGTDFCNAAYSQQEYFRDGSPNSALNSFVLQSSANIFFILLCERGLQSSATESTVYVSNLI